MRFAALACLAAATPLSGCYRWGLSYSQRIIADQGEVPRCDAIVVPGCPARPDGQPSTCIARRVRAAVAAWRAGLAPIVIFSGAAAHNAVAEGPAMADRARRLGLPPAAILIESAALHTVENIAFSARLLRRRGGRRVLLVTDAVQLPFAVEMARREGLDAFGRLAHLPYPRHVVRRYLALDDYEPIPLISWR